MIVARIQEAGFEEKLFSEVIDLSNSGLSTSIGDLYQTFICTVVKVNNFIGEGGF